MRALAETGPTAKGHRQTPEVRTAWLHNSHCAAAAEAPLEGEVQAKVGGRGRRFFGAPRSRVP